ncbi:MAG: hypothetical protein Q9193_002546 [Seirophora villosa]
MTDFHSVAEQFTTFYYSTFDRKREDLAALYYFSSGQQSFAKTELPPHGEQRDQSMLTFESSPVQGTSGIVEKLVSLPFEVIKHLVKTFDAQPSNEQGGIIVMVTGALLVDEEQRPMNYTQVFQLLPDGAGSYFVFNDMFKLIYG